MRPAVLVAALLLLLPLLAGCSSAPEAAPATGGAPLVEGWVVDARLAPVAGARVAAVGLGAEALADGDGHYAFSVPAGVEVLVVAEAEGFVAQSRAVSAGSGLHLVVNFTLERVPAAAPYRTVEAFDGILRCGLVVVVGEDPARPHEHRGVRCSTLTEDDANTWLYSIPSNASGLVVEAVWEPQSELSQSMLLNVSVAATGEVLGFQEGMSPLRAQPSRFKLDLERQAGNGVLSIRVEAGAGTGNHEHGAVGAVAEQEFRLFATAFYNGPVDPAYSVTRPA